PPGSHVSMEIVWTFLDFAELELTVAWLATWCSTQHHVTPIQEHFLNVVLMCALDPKAASQPGPETLTAHSFWQRN
ncbi:hypothetical protein HispidOSU_013631, partial [Sigmodon hispidus]